MISGLLRKVFGSRNDRLIKQYAQAVKRVNAFESTVQALSDEQLRAKPLRSSARLASANSGCVILTSS